jgi:hypothetical protein
VHIVAYEPFFSTPDLLSMDPPLGRLPYLPFRRSALLGQSLAWRQPWPAAFLLILLRVRRSWGLRLGAGGRSPRVLTDTLLQIKNQSF